MAQFYSHPWQMAALVALIVLVIVVVAWLIFRRRPTPEEVERQRRSFLSRYGRVVDGMLLDLREIEAPDGGTLTMLLFSYTIGGVDYACSQEITHMSDVLDAASIRPGFPCSVRYQPGKPQNSIVVAEEWSGLRTQFPMRPTFKARHPFNRNQPGGHGK
jgi:hypothetical protein